MIVMNEQNSPLVTGNDHRLAAENLALPVTRLFQTVRERGGRAFFVGGCVRDMLIGNSIKDLDVEVYGINDEALRSILEQHGRVDLVGQSFAVYKFRPEGKRHLEIDVSLPRRDRKTGAGHKGFTVTYDPDMSIEQASRRRDLTANAVLYDPLEREFIDPNGGIKDIERRLLRAVDPATFIEDSLRVLRIAQLAARLDFNVEPSTVELCRTIDLRDLPPERIKEELFKLLLKSKKPSLGFHLLNQTGAVDQLFPEIAALRGCRQDPEWHPEGDVFIHTLLALDQAALIIEDLPAEKKITVMLAALAHDFGKPATTEFIEGRWRSRGHEEAGVEPTEAFLDRLGIFTINGYNVRAQACALVRDHLKPGELYRRRDEIGDGAFRRLARKCELDLLYRVAKADSLGRNADWVPREKWYGSEAQEWFIQRAKELAVETAAPTPILLGRHLLEMGLAPSPLIGEITRAVYEMQLDGRVRTLDEAKSAAGQLIKSSEK